MRILRPSVYGSEVSDLHGTEMRRWEGAKGMVIGDMARGVKGPWNGAF